MPPAVAQAPIVTRRRRRGAQPGDLLGLLLGADRALDEQDVERAGGATRGRLGELDDVEPLGDGEQLVLEVEERQLAAVARGELDDADARPVRRAARVDGGRRPVAITGPPVPNAGTELGQREDRAVTADEERPELAVAAQRRRRIPCAARGSPRCARGRTPRSPRTSAVACIIRSGPHMKAVTSGAVPGGLVEQLGDDADAAEPLRARRDRRSRRPRGQPGRPARASSSTNRRSPGVRAPR